MCGLEEALNVEQGAVHNSFAIRSTLTKKNFLLIDNNDDDHNEDK